MRVKFEGEHDGEYVNTSNLNLFDPIINAFQKAMVKRERRAMNVGTEPPRKPPGQRQRERDSIVAKTSGMTIVSVRQVRGHAPVWPWSKQPRETQRQYAAFIVYRDLGPTRTIAEIERTVSGAARDWAKLWRWKDRTEQWDEYEERERTRASMRAKRAMMERQARIGVRMQDMAMNALDAGIIQPESVSDVVRLASEGSKLERLALGAPTEHVATVSKFVWNGPLPPWSPPNLLQAAESGQKEVSTNGGNDSGSVQDEAGPDTTGA